MTAQNQGDSLARYNAFVLAAATALAGANASVVIATGGLIGRTLSGDVGLATIPVLFFVVGTAATTFPASFLMRAIGRRGGFIVGSLMGVAGGLVGNLVILKGSFGLFCVSTALCGSYQAFVMQYRFAAADTASLLSGRRRFHGFWRAASPRRSSVPRWSSPPKTAGRRTSSR